MPADDPSTARSTSELVQNTKALLQEKAVLVLDEPVELASGQMSDRFVDGKAGLAAAPDLRLACSAIVALVDDEGIEFDAAGGMTLGADHLAVGVALATDRSWFFVRKEPKSRGTARQIEGATVGPGVRVLVVEDAVSTGGSMFQAIDVIAETGAEIVAAATLIDRGGGAVGAMAERGIPYFPIATHIDLGMAPVSPASGIGA
ncbi:MAG: orotate phosphoribosyltransferase [Acidimicrobiales bacterium]